MSLNEEESFCSTQAAHRRRDAGASAGFLELGRRDLIKAGVAAGAGALMPWSGARAELAQNPAQPAP